MTWFLAVTVTVYVVQPARDLVQHRPPLTTQGTWCAVAMLTVARLAPPHSLGTLDA